MFRNFFSLYRRLLELEEDSRVGALRLLDVGCAGGSTSEDWLDTFAGMAAGDLKIECFEPDLPNYERQLTAKFAGSDVVTVRIYMPLPVQRTWLTPVGLSGAFCCCRRFAIVAVGQSTCV